ncbi:MAG: hypothetical protein K2Z25_01965 [Beijerinckiaceae bacterium]|nr:hypothetical protein [Beijerinckiaceae bacterium]
MSARRKHIPLKAQLHAALYQLGFEPHEVDLDHAPALALRPWDEAAQDTVPPASDPRFLIWRPRADHKVKTFGPGGEKRITSAGGDIHAIAHTRRAAKKQEAFRKRLLAKAEGEPPPETKKRKRPIQSRGFGNQPRPFPNQRKDKRS